MKRLAYLTRTDPAFEQVAAAPLATQTTLPRTGTEPRGKISPVAQRTLFPIREGLHATPEAWEKFAQRAKHDGVSIGQLFRALIYGYGDGKTSIELPPKPGDKQ